MKKQLTSLTLPVALALIPLSAQAAPLTDARTAARGGTGMALSDLRTVTINPASMVSAADAYVAVNLGVGAFVSDADKALDDIDDVQDHFDEFEWAIDELANSFSSTGALADTSRADAAMGRVLDDLERLSDKKLKVEAGGAFTVAVPTRWVKAAVFAQADARVSASFSFDNADRKILEDAIEDAKDKGEHFDSSGVKSSINASGVMVSDFGVALGQATDTQWGQLDYGTALKVQRITLIDRKMNIADEDIEDSFDKETKDDTSLNVDIGIIQHFEGTPWRAAASVENLIPRSVKYEHQGHKSTYKITPQITVGGAYVNNFFKAEANMELLENNGFSEVQANQYVRVGAEIGHRKAAQLRAGYIHDLKGNEKDLFTAGFGLSPFDVFNLDVAGMVGGDRNFGAMVGLGLKI